MTCTRPALAALLLLAACSDNGTASEGSSTAVPGTSGIDPSTSVADPTTTGATTAATLPTSTSGMTSDASSSGGTTVASDPTTGDPTTGVATTGDSTGPVVSTSTGDDTTVGCECVPGDVSGCEGDALLVCADDCVTFAPEPCPNQGESCKDGVCTALFCAPGVTACEGEDSFKQCNAQGSDYDPPVPCAANESCTGGACVPLCEQVKLTPSTIGCSFFANRMDNYYGDQSDALVIGNTSKTKVATVQLYLAPTGQNVEQAQGAPIMIQPGKTHTFTLSNTPIDKASSLRKGGSYRVQSDIPVVAYQHSPLGSQATNDASMMFPEHALQSNYIISSWKQSQPSSPSYFNVIATADNTTVTWTPPVNTSAGNGVPAVAAGQTGMVVLNRFDTLQVIAPNPPGDISGTFVTADKPISVIGANECVNVPSINVLYCDHIEEQMLPLEYWGKSYVGAHSPDRGTEKHYWRVFAGEDQTTITTTPQQPGTPVTLDKGKFVDIVVPNGTSFLFDGDKPFLPVQYLEGQNGGAGTGDPAMYQMIPVEQFLDRYAFATGTNYNLHYAQIIRVKGGPDVFVDGVAVSGYYTVGNFEVADWKIGEGGHLAESVDPFGILNIGYTGVTSYAYPGGTRLKIINPQ